MLEGTLKKNGQKIVEGVRPYIWGAQMQREKKCVDANETEKRCSYRFGGRTSGEEGEAHIKQ